MICDVNGTILYLYFLILFNYFPICLLFISIRTKYDSDIDTL